MWEIFDRGKTQKPLICTWARHKKNWGEEKQTILLPHKETLFLQNDKLVLDDYRERRAFMKEVEKENVKSPASVFSYVQKFALNKLSSKKSTTKKKQSIL